MPKDPDSGKGRAHRDWAGQREITRPGPHVDGADFLAAEATPVDALTDAAQDVSDAARSLAAHAISRAEADGIRMRLANLETWRAGDVDPWRLRLTGVADTNGRLGRMDARIDDLRKDVGPSEERHKERESIATQRGDRKRVVAALLAAATLAGGGLYTIRDRYDAAAEARGAEAQWRRGVDENFRALFGLFGLRVPVPTGVTP